MCMKSTWCLGGEGQRGCGGSAAQGSSGRCTLAARGMLEKKGSGGATPFAFGVGRCSALALHTDWPRKVDRVRAGATHEKASPNGISTTFSSLISTQYFVEAA